MGGTRAIETRVLSSPTTRSSKRRFCDHSVITFSYNLAQSSHIRQLSLHMYDLDRGNLNGCFQEYFQYRSGRLYSQRSTAQVQMQLTPSWQIRCVTSSLLQLVGYLLLYSTTCHHNAFILLLLFILLHSKSRVNPLRNEFHVNGQKLLMTLPCCTLVLQSPLTSPSLRYTDIRLSPLPARILLTSCLQI